MEHLAASRADRARSARRRGRGRDDLAAIATLADGIQGRLTTPDRILAALGTRSRISRRDFLRMALVDVAAGACSALEHGYLTRVERPHGLPTAERQLRDSVNGTIYRDVRYPAYGVDLELDGRLFHDTACPNCPGGSVPTI